MFQVLRNFQRVSEVDNYFNFIIIKHIALYPPVLNSQQAIIESLFLLIGFKSLGSRNH